MVASGPVRAVPAAAPGTEVEIRVEGLRSSRGMVRLCLTRDPHHYPDCDGDPAARRRSVEAGAGTVLRLSGVEPGSYALLVLHDENGNSRVDSFLGIPKEGVGFSRNPRLFMGPPSFDAVRFDVGAQPIVQTVRMRYFL